MKQPTHATTARLTLLVAALTAASLGCESSPNPETSVELSKEEIEGLEALGYVDFGEPEPTSQVGVVEHQADKVAPGYLLYVERYFATATLIDREGNVVRSWTDPHAGHWSHMELLDNGDLLGTGSMRNHEGVPDWYTETRQYMIRFSWDGRILWRAKIGAHHDAEELPDGRLAVLTKRRRKIPQLSDEFDTVDNLVTLTKADGEVIRSVSIFESLAKRPDLITIDKRRPMPLGPKGKGIDIVHANSVEWILRPDLQEKSPIFAPQNVLVSLRHQDSAVIINSEKQEVVWAWGQGELMGPHDATLLENGHILIFDNGMERQWSRVLEVDPLTREVVWEYQDPKDKMAFYTRSRGGAQRLPNGNTLITSSDQGRAFEVTPSGERVWHFINPRGDDNRRATLIRMNLVPPSLVDPLLRSP